MGKLDLTSGPLVKRGKEVTVPHGFDFVIQPEERKKNKDKRTDLNKSAVVCYKNFWFNSQGLRRRPFQGSNGISRLELYGFPS